MLAAWGSAARPAQVDLRVGLEIGLEAGSRRRFGVPLDGGQLLHVAVDQRGVDVDLRLLAPDGREVWHSDDRAQGSDREWVWWVADEPGIHTLVIEGKDTGKASGSVVVTELIRRAATDEDRLRADLERSLSRIELLRRDRARGSLTQCVEEAQKAIAILDKAPGAEFAPRRRHAALAGLGICLRDLGQIAEARATFTQDIADSKARGSPEAEADTLAYLANLEWSQGDFVQAARLTEKAADIYARLHRPSGEGFARNNLGIYFNLLGRMDRAGESYARAIECFREARSESGEALAELNLGESYRRQGRVDEAFAALDGALRGARRLRNRTWEATALNSLGALFGDLGDSEAARQYAEHALAIRHEMGDRRAEASARSNIAETMLDAGDAAGARGELNAALELCRQAGDKDGEAWALYLLGRVEVHDGARPALATWRKALEIRRETGAVEEEAWILAEMGRVETDARSTDDARGHLQESLDTFRAIDQPNGEAQALYLRARLERLTGDRAAALRDVRAAIERSESVRARVADTDLRASYLAKARPYYELEMDLLLGSGLSPSSGTVVDAFSLSERARSRALLDLLAGASADLDATLDPDLLARRRDLEMEISAAQDRLVKVSGKDRDSSAGREARDLLDRAFADYDRLREEIRRTNARYATLVYPEPGGLDEARRLVGSSTALLEYFVGETASYLFVVDARGIEVHRVPARDDLDTWVASLRAALEDRGPLGRGRLALAARRLYEALIEPAEKRLRPGVSLLVAPDGPLYGVPFEVLLSSTVSDLTSSRAWPYLLRDHSVSYVPSAAVAEELRPPAVSRSLDLFAVGSPDVAGGGASQGGAVVGSLFGTSSLQPLPGSLREVQRIARLFPPDKVHVLVGEAATEAAVKGGPLGQARYLHFATHSLVSERQPSESGLVVAKDSRDDGFLQVHEILRLKLNADLVTLSACRTGLGKELPGEGILGLVQAFLYAGCRGVVASLWSVDDDSTSDLMAGFYERLASGASPDRALQGAKLQLLQSAWENPHDWAPFILVGPGR